MAMNWLILFQSMAILLASILSLTLSSSVINEDRKVHIVYMGSLRNMEYSRKSHHFNLLQSVLESSDATASHIRSYGRSFNGFAAKLTESERDKLASMEGVVSVFPSQKLKTQTTRSWDFVGFHQEIKRDPTSESDIIIGSIDTGIWPESESFKDNGFGPPPLRWKGVCAGGINFTCNNKLIGARYYTNSSARDDNGHGTHTASTAAGNPVKASFYSLAEGVARGGVPSARIAAYRACETDCKFSDILAAFDDAIADGVDVITISLGGFFAADFKSDVIAIGSFHAMERGILTVQAAGNSGPFEGSVESMAPWLFSVGATTTDRNIIDKVVLGNGKTLVGNAVNSFTPGMSNLPLISGTNASRNCSEELSATCSQGCLDHDLVKGKIVQCTSFAGVSEAIRAGASGSIFRDDKIPNVSFIVPFPASGLNVDDFDEDIADYINSTNFPLAKILKSEALKDATAPKVAFFSSRGPNRLIPEIMKPDISAPGVEILAAFSPVVSPSGDNQDKRSAEYSILSGTSMACPHVAGVASYVKSFHPDWSPSAIKSAVMTTAMPINNTDENNIGEYLYGSGQINPIQAINPGLVYETSKDDYINLLCNIGYDTKSVRLISGDNSTCSTKEKNIPPKDLNYPGMVVQVLPMEPFVVEFQRTVTNVGIANSTYQVKFLPFFKVYVSESSEELKVIAKPQVLSFETLNQKKSFTVTVVGGRIPAETIFSSSLVWSDGIHSVRSPIVVKVIPKPDFSN